MTEVGTEEKRKGSVVTHVNTGVQIRHLTLSTDYGALEAPASTGYVQYAMPIPRSRK